MMAPVANCRSKWQKEASARARCPLSSHSPWCIRNGVPAICGQGGPSRRKPMPAWCRVMCLCGLPPPTTAVTFCCCGVAATTAGSAIPPARLYGTRQPWRSLSAQTSQRGATEKEERTCAITAWKASLRGRPRSGTSSFSTRFGEFDHPRLQRGRCPECGGLPVAGHRARVRSAMSSSTTFSGWDAKPCRRASPASARSTCTSRACITTRWSFPMDASCW